MLACLIESSIWLYVAFAILDITRSMESHGCVSYYFLVTDMWIRAGITWTPDIPYN